ncbi:MAG: ABC transporter ATP-binding protein, partial [Proteobacteria bacterium]|nr:ABC transporter ATP-binding protein [Pseudomonadota bacterium]
DPYSHKLLSAILPGRAQQKLLEPSAPLLSVKNLKVYFPIKKGLFRTTMDTIKAVDDISFEIAGAETFALVGESGSGKTTTAKAIVRLLSAKGQVILNGIDLLKASQKTLREQRANIQIIFQDPYSALNPRMTIGDSLKEGLKLQKTKHSFTEHLCLLDNLLKKVDLPVNIKKRYPHEFSGGERQRICLVRALVLQPKVLILDEPTSALDVSIQKQMLVLLENLQKELGITYLLITHDLGVVAYLAHRMAVMHQGKIVEQGATERILANPQNHYTKRLLTSL